MKLKLENFRNFGNVETEFGKINIIAGKSGSGKSTIKAGLAYAYTGINILNGSDRIIKDRTDLAKVALQDGFLAIERRSKAGSNEVRLNGSKITNKTMEEELIDKLGMPYQTMVMMFDSSRFLSLSENEQKDYLYHICDMKITTDTLKNYCTLPLSSKAEEFLYEEFGTGTIEPKQLDTAYKVFFAKRADKKKELATVNNKVEGFGGKNIPCDADEVKKKISAIDAKLKKLDAEKSKLMIEFGSSKEREKQIKILEKNILNFHERIQALELQIDPNIDIGEAEMDVFGIIQKIFKLEEQYKETSGPLSFLKGEVKANKEIIGKLATQGCPLTSKLTCTADKGLLKKSLEDAIKDKETEIAKLEKILAKIELDLNIEKKEKDRLEKQILLDQKKTEITKRKTEAELGLNEIPAVNPIIAQQVEEKQSEITNLQNDRKSFSIAAENVVILAELKKSQESLEIELEALETLVTELSPKGVKQTILQKVLDKVEKFGNEAVKEIMPNNEIRFNFNNGFQIELIDTKMDSRRTANELSSGEKLRLSIVFQYIFSNITGARIIFVDDLNLVDQSTRADIFKLLKDISNNFDQMFISITEDDMNNLLSYQTELGADKAFFVYEGDIIEQ